MDHLLCTYIFLISASLEPSKVSSMIIILHNSDWMADFPRGLERAGIQIQVSATIPNFHC